MTPILLPYICHFADDALSYHPNDPPAVLIFEADAQAKAAHRLFLGRIAHAAQQDFERWSGASLSGPLADNGHSDHATESPSMRIDASTVMNAVKAMVGTGLDLASARKVDVPAKAHEGTTPPTQYLLPSPGGEIRIADIQATLDKAFGPGKIKAHRRGKEIALEPQDMAASVQLEKAIQPMEKRA